MWVHRIGKMFIPLNCMLVLTCHWERKRIDWFKVILLGKTWPQNLIKKKKKEKALSVLISTFVVHIFSYELRESI